jgi:probable HAF family extracellular repeat protein
VAHLNQQWSTQMIGAKGTQMRVRKLVVVGVLPVVALCVLTIGSAASSAQTYAIEPIDAPVGFTHVYPSHISAAGEIVGTALSENNVVQHAFAWSDGTSIDLGTLGGAVSSARGVNEVGVIVGEAGTGGIDDEVHAAAWDSDGLVSDLGEPGRASGAFSINSHGLIVGYQRDQLGSKSCRALGRRPHAPSGPLQLRIFQRDKH